jgi:hypothetical protein
LLSFIQVSIAEMSFDALTAVHISGVSVLNLSPASLKPRAFQFKERPDLEILLEDVRSLPSIPVNAFTSARSITLRRCQERINSQI